MKDTALVLSAMILAVILPIAAAWCIGCGSTPAPAPRVVDCGARYSSCVALSKDIAAYRLCRANVDAVCLSTDAGTE